MAKPARSQKRHIDAYSNIANGFLQNRLRKKQPSLRLIHNSVPMMCPAVATVLQANADLSVKCIQLLSACYILYLLYDVVLSFPLLPLNSNVILLKIINY